MGQVVDFRMERNLQRMEWERMLKTRNRWILGAMSLLALLIFLLR